MSTTRDREIVQATVAEARCNLIEEMMDKIGSTPMGDYLIVGDEILWLNREECQQVLDLLSKMASHVCAQ